MAARNPWILPAAILLVLMVLAAVIFAGAAIRGGLITREPAVNILHVPANYSNIQAAIDAAQAGDIIVVAAGTYNENITLNKSVSLAAEAYDQINPTNNATILDGGNGDATILIPGGLAQMPSITGFAIRNSRDGIQAHSEFIAESNYFYGSQMPVDYLTGSGGINRNNVYFDSGNDAIHVDDMNKPLLIENNRFLYAGDDAIEIDLRGDSVPAGPVEVNIWNNMLIGSRQDGLKFVDFAMNPQDTNRRFTVTRNLLANNRRAGIGMMHSDNTNEDYSAVDTAEAVRVYNNTFYGNDYGISGGDNLVAFNNIIANTSSRGAWRVQGAVGANSVIAYTLFYNNRVDTDQTTMGAGNIFGQDPLFMAAPSPGPDGQWGTVDDDFSGLLLQTGSPAIDRGVTQYATANGEVVPPSPITGFVSVAPDLGWREYGSPVFITPTPIGTPTATLPVTATAVSSVTAGPSATSGPTSTSTAAPATPTTAAASPTAPAATATNGAPTAGTTNTPQGSIQGISPVSASAGSTVNVTVSGSGFQSGATVSFEGADGNAPQVTGVQVLSSTSIALTVKVSDEVSDTQMWDVKITNPDGTTFVLVDAFTVNP